MITDLLLPCNINKQIINLLIFVTV